MIIHYSHGKEQSNHFTDEYFHYPIVKHLMTSQIDSQYSNGEHTFDDLLDRYAIFKY